MNRERRGENIFWDDQDYVMFTELLIETAEMWNVRIAACCLMPNHYHMLIQTPDANISQYGIDNDRTVRSVFERVKKRLNEDINLAYRMENLQDSIKKVKNGLDPFLDPFLYGKV